MIEHQANVEDKITQWLLGHDALARDARIIVRGNPIPPNDEIFEYGDQDLMEWVYNILHQEHFGHYVMGYLGINSGYPAVLMSQVNEEEILNADWSIIRRNLIDDE